MKKILSLILTLFVLSNFLSSVLVGSMDIYENPLTGGDYESIEEYFKEQFAKTKSKHIEIGWPPKPKKTDGKKEEEDIIKYARSPIESDQRTVEVYNAPHLLEWGNEGNFLNAMLRMYAEAREVADKSHKANISPKVFTEKVTEKIVKGMREDNLVIETIDMLKGSLNLTYEEASRLYLIKTTSVALESKFSKIAIASFVESGALFAGAIFSGLLSAGVIPAAKFGRIGVAMVGVPVFGVPLACICFGISGALAATASYKAYVKSGEMKEARYQIQECENFAKMISQFHKLCVISPNKILNSNLFVMAVDKRNFKFRKEEINHGGWCNFIFMKDLQGAPLMETYISKDGRRMRDYINLFRGITKEGIDYQRVRNRLEGKELIPNSIPLSPKEIAKKMLKRGILPEDVIEDTGLTLEEVKRLLDKSTDQGSK